MRIRARWRALAVGDAISFLDTHERSPQTRIDRPERDTSDRSELNAIHTVQALKKRLTLDGSAGTQRFRSSAETMGKSHAFDGARAAIDVLQETRPNLTVGLVAERGFLANPAERFQDGRFGGSLVAQDRNGERERAALIGVVVGGHGQPRVVTDVRRFQPDPPSRARRLQPDEAIDLHAMNPVGAHRSRERRACHQ